jgi:predicted 3-demethylubiquinone-9 3-methyltransferase (glyoxalase superfamily)
VNCDTQEEVDDLWNRLSEGGKELQCGWLIDKCGWLIDKFGVSWQVCPSVLVDMIQDKDAMKSERVMGAMLQMKKLDIQRLRMAYEGR